MTGPLLGAAQHFGYRLAFAAGTTLCVGGLCLLLTTHRPGSHQD